MSSKNQNNHLRPSRAAAIAAIATDIQQRSASEAGTIVYGYAPLIKATLPHSKPISNEFERVNGSLTITMMAPSKIGLPYGPLPRLILSWIITEAVVKKSEEVYLGNSLSEFMRKLGLNAATGGDTGSIRRVKEQMRRLLATNITLVDSRPEQETFSHLHIADEAVLFWNPINPDSMPLWQSKLVLNNGFVKKVLDRPVPLDLRALLALKESTLALDIYCWITHRMFNLARPIEIFWADLQQQFGSDYARSEDFKANFKKQLRAVITVYPAAIVKHGKDGVLLVPSKPHVSRKPKVKKQPDQS